MHVYNIWQINKFIIISTYLKTKNWTIFCIWLWGSITLKYMDIVCNNQNCNWFLGFYIICVGAFQLFSSKQAWNIQQVLWGIHTYVLSYMIILPLAPFYIWLNNTKTLHLCFLMARLEILPLNSGKIKGTPQVSVHDNRELFPSALTFSNTMLTLSSCPVWAISLGCLWYLQSWGWKHPFTWTGVDSWPEAHVTVASVLCFPIWAAYLVSFPGRVLISPLLSSSFSCNLNLSCICVLVSLFVLCGEGGECWVTLCDHLRIKNDFVNRVVTKTALLKWNEHGWNGRNE